MRMHLTFMPNKNKTGIYTVWFASLKELFCNSFYDTDYGKP